MSKVPQPTRSLNFNLEDSDLFWLARLDDDPAPTFAAGADAVAGLDSFHVHLPAASNAQVARDDGLVVVFDGELFDTRALLGATGNFATEYTQAELLLRGYRSRGANVLPLLSGTYALVIWDRDACKLVVARDRVGARALCYAVESGRVLVSPSPELLVAAGVPAALNRVAIAEWVLRASIGISETFYSHVHRLPPGHALEWKRRHVRVWQLQQPQTEVLHSLSPEEAHEEFDRLLRASVGHALAGRPAVFLSGGVDSALVAAIAAEGCVQAGSPAPLALSLRFPYPGGDESAVQHAIAEDLGLPMLMRTLGETSGSDGTLVNALRLSKRSWLPPVNPWQAAYETLAQEAAQSGCGCLLTGEGGNDVLEPSWDEISQLLIGRRVSQLRQLARAWIDHHPDGSETAIYKAAFRLSMSKGLRLLIGPLPEPARLNIVRFLARSRRRSIPPWAIPDQSVREEFLERRVRVAATGSELRSGFDQGIMTTWLETCHLLEQRLRIPVRNPYLDMELLVFRARTPTDNLIFEGRYKGLGRASYSRRVNGPSKNLLGPAYFSDTLNSLVDTELPAALRYLGGGLTHLADLGIVSREEFVSAQSFSKLAARSPRSSLRYYEIWQLLACEAWLASR